jgi:choice-of-anchor C domain-containing protein
MKILGLLAGAALLVGAQSAHAVTIVNGDFENVTPTSPTFGTDGYSQEEVGSTAIHGWTVDSGNVDIVGSYWQQPGGNFSLDLAGNQSGTISQLLTGLTLNQEYTISFSYAANPGGSVPTVIEIGLDDGQLATFDFTPQTVTDMGWTTVTWAFVASATDQLLHFTSIGAGCCGAALDNVTIAATPIPAAFLLFGTALGGMGFLGYRRKQLDAAA